MALLDQIKATVPTAENDQQFSLKVDGVHS